MAIQEDDSNVVDDPGSARLSFVHYEGWGPEHADWVSATCLRPLSLAGSVRFGPNGKEDDASWEDYRASYYSEKASSLIRHHTGLVQDRRMLWHACPCNSRRTVHPECPERTGAILKALQSQR